jgi:hypothetical protein
VKKLLTNRVTADSHHIDRPSPSGASPVRTAKDVLGANFGGVPCPDMSEVILKGLEDPRRAERGPALIEILQCPESSDLDQFLSCIALTSWAVPEGFTAVADACRDPEQSVWRGLSIDRMYPADDVFSELAEPTAVAPRYCRHRSSRSVDNRRSGGPDARLRR